MKPHTKAAAVTAVKWAAGLIETLKFQAHAQQATFDIEGIHLEAKQMQLTTPPEKQVERYREEMSTYSDTVQDSLSNEDTEHLLNKVTLPLSPWGTLQTRIFFAVIQPVQNSYTFKLKPSFRVTVLVASA